MEFNALTQTLLNFLTAFSSGYSNLLPSINWLIGALLGIELILIGFWWALGGGEQLGGVIKKILFIGFWMWIVLNFPMLANKFVFSLIDAGLIAGGGTAGNDSILMDPSRIAGLGLSATDHLYDMLNNVKWDISDALVFGISYILIMLAFLIIAWQVFLCVLEFYLILAITGILLPFGFIKYTKFLAEKAIGAVIAHGIKLMVLAFIIAVVEPVLSSITFAGPEIKMNEIWSVLLTSWAIALLAWNAPGMAAGLLSGSPSLTAGTALQNTAAGAYLGAQSVAGSIAATRAAASAAGTVGAGALRLAGNASTGYARGAAFTSGSSAEKVVGGLKGAGESLVKSAYGAVSSPVKNAVQGNYQKGVASSYQAITGSIPEGMGGSSSPVVQKPAPEWAKKMLAASRNIQEARPSGGSANPKL